MCSVNAPPARPSRPRALAWLLGPSIALASAAGTTHAATIQYLSGVATQTSSPAVLPTVPDLPGATGFERSFAQQMAASSSQIHGAESASASASLQTGTLRVATAFSSNGVLGGQTLASAFIGDGFAFSGPGGSPYIWNGQTVTFDIRVTGQQSVSLPAGIGAFQYFDFSLLALMIYQPGTLDDVVPFCNGPGVTNVVASFFWSVGENGSATDPCGNPFLGNLSGNVNRTVSASFAPTGDFAWALGFRAINASASGLPGPISWNYLFGNTIEYGFTAPADARVSTASGVPPGGVPASVPLPGSALLMAAALAGLTWSRRTRPVRHRGEGACAYPGTRRA